LISTGQKGTGIIFFLVGVCTMIMGSFALYTGLAGVWAYRGPVKVASGLDAQIYGLFFLVGGVIMALHGVRLYRKHKDEPITKLGWVGIFYAAFFGVFFSLLLLVVIAG
jgi:hypothetical protein